MEEKKDCLECTSEFCKLDNDFLNKYEQIASKTEQLMYDYNITDGSIKWSGDCKVITGENNIKIDDIDFQKWISMIHPEDFAKVSKDLEKSLKQNDTFKSVYRFYKDDGTKIYIFDEGKFYTSQSGNIHLFGSMKDITDFKKTEIKLKEKTDVLQAVFDNASIGIARLSTNFKIIQSNNMFENILNLDDPNIKKFNFDDHIIEEDKNIFYKALKNSSDYKINSEIIIRLKNSEFNIFTKCNVSPIFDKKNRIKFYVIVIEDITTQTIADEVIRENKKTLKKVFDNTGLFVSMFDKYGYCLMMNNKLALLFGGVPKDFVGKNLNELFPDKAYEYHEIIKEVIESGQEIDMEHKFEFNNKTAYLFSNIYPLKNSKNKIYATQIISNDMTRYKEAQTKLKSSEKKFKTMVENLPCIVYRCDFDKDFTMQYLSEQCYEITGYEVNELLNNKERTFMDIIHPDDIDYIQKEIDRAIKNSIQYILEYRIIKKDGNIIWVNEKGQGFSNKKNSKMYLEGVIFDITEQKTLKERIVQTEKMISVGGLAAGMAHEINNPLSGILQSIFNTKRRLSKDNKKNNQTAEELGLDLNTMHEYLNKRKISNFLDGMEKSAIRAASIVENMLKFSRKSNHNKEFFDIEESIDNVLSLLENEYELKKHFDFKFIKIRKKYYKKNMKYYGIKEEIEQVLLNIIKNSAHAMCLNGIKSPHIIIEWKEKQNKTIIQIRDNGPGIDEEIKNRIFEPFFTTKSVGSGTGLGLSVSYFIISENHSGKLFIKNKPKKGACFVIELPKMLQNNI